MQRGFKTQAERLSCQLRAEMGLSAHSPLPGKQLIAHLKVLLIEPADVPGIGVELLREVLDGSSERWSAITFYDKTGQAVIIFNPRHAPSRQESDLMHEAAHILRKHPPAKIVRVGGFAMRSYDESQEEEAKWLGACLQITRDGLLWAIRQEMTTEAMAEFFGASEALVRFRRNTSGVDLQMKRYRAYRKE